MVRGAVLALATVLVATGCELPRAWDVPWLLECSSPPFERSVLDAAPVPADSTDPAHVAARSALDDDAFGFGLEEPFWELHRDDDSATFLFSPLPDLDAPVPSGEGGPVITVRQIDGAWRLWGGSSRCGLRTVIDGYGASDWWLDLSHGLPGPDATELHVLVQEPSCSSGDSATGRIREPAVVLSDDAIIIGVTVTPKGGFQTCPLPPATPFVIALPEPRGDRPLFDGGSYPAVWAMPEPYRTWAASGGQG